MEEPSTGGVTFLKGIGLVFGGAALGFFGCLGALSMNSGPMVLIMLFLGAAVIVWGIVMMCMGLWRGLSKS